MKISFPLEKKIVQNKFLWRKLIILHPTFVYKYQAPWCILFVKNWDAKSYFPYEKFILKHFFSGKAYFHIIFSFK